MITFVCEDSPLGFYSSVFKAYVDKTFPDKITSSKIIEQDLSSHIICIENNIQGAERVKKAITKYTSSYINKNIELVLKNCSPLREIVCFNYVKLIFEKKCNVDLMLHEQSVIDFNFLKQKVLYEKHRFKGFLRFLETKNNVLYAHYEPDNDITEILTPHFIERLKGKPFIIHDVKRNKLALYNGENVKYVISESPLSIYFSDSENELQSLWRKYFESVNIDSRPHLKQQNAYLPKRYRKHLLEFNYIDKNND